MGILGDLAKVILITWVVYWVVAMVWFAIRGETVMLVLFSVGLLVPLSFIVYEYWQYRRK